MSKANDAKCRYLVASDFDQTLSFNDSGYVLADLMGVRNFQEKVEGLSKTSLVQQGAELAYLLRHDPEFRSVRRENLIEAGKRVRLKKNVDLLAEFLSGDVDGCNFVFYVVSAGPKEVVESALEGIVPPERIFGTEFEYDPATGEISSIRRASAGFGKVVVLEELKTRLQIASERTIYVGDGSSDLYAMQHVNGGDGYTIAVSEAKQVTRVAKRTVLSDNALSVLAPLLEDLLGWNSLRIRELFAARGLALQDWDKSRTDRLRFHEPESGRAPSVAEGTPQ